MNNNLRKYNKYLIALVVLLSLAINACGNDSEEISNVRVERAELVKTPVEPPQEIHLDNCDNKGPNKYDTSIQVQQSKNINVSSKASGSGGVEVKISGAATAKLQGEIENTYQETFGSAITRGNSLTIELGPQSDVYWIVTWEEQKYTSTVSFEMNGKSYRTRYTYSFRIPIDTETKPGTKCPSCDVTGTVYNRDDNKPIANVAIGSTFGEPILGYTNPNGQFELNCREATFEQFPLRLTVYGVVSGCGVGYSSNEYIEIGEQRYNVSIYVTKSTIELACSQQ